MPSSRGGSSASTSPSRSQRLEDGLAEGDAAASLHQQLKDDDNTNTDTKKFSEEEGGSDAARDVEEAAATAAGGSEATLPQSNAEDAASPAAKSRGDIPSMDVYTESASPIHVSEKNEGDVNHAVASSVVSVGGGATTASAAEGAPSVAAVLSDRCDDNANHADDNASASPQKEDDEGAAHHTMLQSFDALPDDAALVVPPIVVTAATEDAGGSQVNAEDLTTNATSEGLNFFPMKDDHGGDNVQHDSFAALGENVSSFESSPAQRPMAALSAVPSIVTEAAEKPAGGRPKTAGDPAPTSRPRTSTVVNTSPPPVKRAGNALAPSSSMSLASSRTRERSLSTFAQPTAGQTRPRTLTAGPALNAEESGGGTGSASLSRDVSEVPSNSKDGASSGVLLSRARSRTFEKSTMSTPIFSNLSRALPSKRGASASASTNNLSATTSRLVGTGGTSATQKEAGHEIAGGSVSYSNFGQNSPGGARRVARQPSGSFRMQGGRPMTSSFTQKGREEAERKREAERREEEARKKAEEEEAAKEERKKQDDIKKALLSELARIDGQIQCIDKLQHVREAIVKSLDETNSMMPTVVRHGIEARKHKALLQATTSIEGELGERKALIQHLTATIDVMGRKLPEWRASLSSMLEKMATEISFLDSLVSALAERERTSFSSSRAMASIREVVECDQDRFGVLSACLAKVKTFKEQEKHIDREMYGLDELIAVATTSTEKSCRRRQRIAKAAEYTDYTKLLQESSSSDDEGLSVEEMNAKLFKNRKTSRHRSMMIKAGAELKDAVEEEDADEFEDDSETSLVPTKRGGSPPPLPSARSKQNAPNSANLPQFADPRAQLKQKRAMERQVKRLHVQRMKAEHAVEMSRLLQFRKLMVTTVKDQHVTNRRQGALGLSTLFEKAIERVKRQQQATHSVSGNASLRQSFNAGSFGGLSALFDPSSFVHSADNESAAGCGADVLSTTTATQGPNSTPPPPPTSYQRMVERTLTKKIESLAAVIEKVAAKIEETRKEVDETKMEIMQEQVQMSEHQHFNEKRLDAIEGELKTLREQRRDLFAQRDTLTRQLKVQRNRATVALKGPLLAEPAKRIVNGKPMVGYDLWEGGADMVNAMPAIGNARSVLSPNAAPAGAAGGASPSSPAPPTIEVNVPEMAEAIMVRDLFDIIDVRLGLKDPREALGRVGSYSYNTNNASTASKAKGSSSTFFIQEPFKVTRQIDPQVAQSMRGVSDVAVDDPFYATPEVLDIIYNRGASAERGTTKRGTTAIVRPTTSGRAKGSVDKDSLFARLSGTKTAAAESRMRFTAEENAMRANRDTFAMPVAAPVPKRAPVTPRRTTKQ